MRVLEPDVNGNITGDIIVLRPPEGWETRDSTQSSRWAWIDEPKSRLETSLASIVVPSMWRLKLLSIVFLSWLVTVLMVLFVTLLPLLIGRSILTALRVPDCFRHDPISFVLGVILYRRIEKFVKFTGIPDFRRDLSGIFTKVFYSCKFLFYISLLIFLN